VLFPNAHKPKVVFLWKVQVFMGSSLPSGLMEPFNQREVDILCLIKQGLTNLEIAHHLFLSLETIKWYNQKIYNKLGVNNRTQALEKAGKYGLIDPQAAPASGTSPRFQHNLPARLSSFIGRKKELSMLRRLFQAKDIRLVTIVGPNGIGKTRLGLELTHRLAVYFRDGAFFISLAPLNDPGMVASAIAQVLGLHETRAQPILEALKDTLRDRQLLLMLDNFEHLLPAALLASDLLVCVPGLKILATSRAPLCVYGEHLFILPPLPVPDPRNLPPHENLLRFDSTRLFVERARAVHPGFALSTDNAASVAEICHRLDGLPLAIELAAARAQGLSPADIAAQFDGRSGFFPFHILAKGPKDAPARHQTLHNAIAWSYDLLEADEQALFRRLGVFAGGCTLEAVEAICQEKYPAVESLVDKNLLIRSEFDGEPRFEMLEMIRAYALEQLEQSSEGDLIHQQHAEYYLSLIKDSDSKLNSPNGLAWLSRLEREWDNLRLVLAWGLSASSSMTLEQRLSVVKDQLEATHLPSSERRQWLEKALSLLAEIPGAFINKEQRCLQAELWQQAGGTAYFQGDYPAARGFMKKGVSIFQKLNNKLRLSGVLIGLSWTFLALGEPGKAKASAERALYLGRQIEDAGVIAHALNHLGGLAWSQGKYDQADSLLAESQACFKEAQDPLWEAILYVSMGMVAQDRGDQARARFLYLEGLTRCWQLTDLWGIGLSLEKVALSAAAYGQLMQAARLFAVADTLFQSYGYALENQQRRRHEFYLSRVKDGLGAASFTAAWAEGQSLSLEQAVALALDLDWGVNGD
jgi:predicted ATPase/DNA-binding CsgD family transcriptional regulator